MLWVTVWLLCDLPAGMYSPRIPLTSMLSGMKQARLGPWCLRRKEGRREEGHFNLVEALFVQESPFLALSLHELTSLEENVRPVTLRTHWPLLGHQG